jgi:glycosidase
MRFISLLTVAPFALQAGAQTVSLDTRSAVVWSRDQVVTGSTDAPTGTLYLDDEAIPFVTESGRFLVPVRLDSGEHGITACAGDPEVCSGTATLTLGFELRPEAYAWATSDGSSVVLHARLVRNPDDAEPSFAWSADPGNPAAATVSSPADSVTAVLIAPEAPDGEYYFDLEATIPGRPAGRARTFVTVRGGTVTPFDIRTDNAAWIDDAVIYEVTPYNFVRNGGIADVTARLPELHDLGINTVWLQPVFGTGFGGQGYDITDYFSVRPDYGTEEDLHALIGQAHDLGMHVLFDFVPNHSSILHPYAQDAIEYGAASHYFDFYQRERDDVLYSTHYHERYDGEMTFVYYFWEDLPNLNYDNPEVREWITRAGLRWVEDFDIDGYRIDAVWGVNARAPEVMQDWRFDLKRVKPEILLLGEDKATRPESFDNRFDVAYDWAPEELWVSHWSWQTDYSEFWNPTIFNYSNEAVRARLLRYALTNRGNGFHPDAKVLRFLENNDTFRFLATHEPDGRLRTGMAATLLFSLPGIPLVYNGQEIGFPTHPYSTNRIYETGPSMEEQDLAGLFPVYRHLARTRARFRALRTGGFEELAVSPSQAAGRVFAYRRYAPGENIFCVANMGLEGRDVVLDVPTFRLGIKPGSVYWLTDLVTGEARPVAYADLGQLELAVPGYTTQLLALAANPIAVDVERAAGGAELPTSAILGPAWPNPFDNRTVIPVSLPGPERVRLTAYDVLGRRVGVLLDEVTGPGDIEVPFDATALPPGLYVLRLESGSTLRTKSVVKAR